MKIKRLVVAIIAIIGLAWSSFTIGRAYEVSTNKQDVINMNDVANIETSDEGVLIVLNDGNGYYWER